MQCTLIESNQLGIMRKFVTYTNDLNVDTVNGFKKFKEENPALKPNLYRIKLCRYFKFQSIFKEYC